MFRGKAGSLQFLKDLNLSVPEWKVYDHKIIIGWGNSELYKALEKALHKKDKNEVILRVQDFVNSLKFPNFDFNKPSYAVRSSASLEDSPDNSFAGIFETALEITPHDIPLAIKKVWLSLYDDKALSYCQDRGLKWTDLQMNIIVQEMIIGEKSGVMFQADPMGKIHQQIIVAGLGLGQGIVDDQVETDRYIIENKKVVDTTLIAEPILNQPEIDQLINASAIIAAKTPFFMDLEFTFLKGQLFVLQARPITTLAPKKSIQIFDNSILNLSTTTIWIIGITNAFNFIDNMDGLAGGVAMFAAFGFFIISLSNGQLLVAALSAAICGSCIGFLFWNKNPARIYMGDSGALFLGFMLAAISIRVDSDGSNYLQSIFTPLVMLAIPFIDTAQVIISRLRQGVSPLQGGRDHISHKLLLLGVSEKTAVQIIWLCAIIFSLIAIAISGVLN